MAVMRLVLVAATLLVAAPVADAASSPFFRTPSKNIYCAYFGSLRCDIRSGLKPTPAKPAGCEFDWGQTYVLGRTARARIGCVSDSVFDPNAAALAYGRTWRRGGISCASRRSGLRCTNRSGHGFLMSRARSHRF